MAYMQNKFLITLLKLHNQLKYLFFVLQANTVCIEIFVMKSILFLLSFSFLSIMAKK